MREYIIKICLVGSMLIFLDSMQAGHWLVLLLFVGLIPGTSIYISPIDMMSAMATAMTVVILRIAFWSRVRSFLFTNPANLKKDSLRRIA